MIVARQSLFGWLADAFRYLGRKSLVVPEAFDRLADWCAEQSK